MDYQDRFHPTEENDFLGDDEIHNLKSYDHGYNKIYRHVLRNDGRNKRTKIDIYTSGRIGSRIRDAETGEYFSAIVGSTDEDDFFKVSLSTGECKSKNQSKTLFFQSPSHYFSYMNMKFDKEIECKWAAKKERHIL